jgi:phosphoribosyl 1,2-cyclic phosphate phosphodiesterase
MRVTFLGSGTSHGIPQIGCDCAVCRSPDPRNQRLRASLLVETADATVLVDATPDFRTQALQAGLRRVDAVLLTHAHADHVLGLDDLRVFTQERPLPVLGSAETLADVRRIFAYACREKPVWPGVPRFELREIAAGKEFAIGSLRCRAVEAWHHQMSVLGFVFADRLAYLTDCNRVPAPTIAALRGIPILVLDGLRHRAHIAHLTVAEALAVAAAVQPQQTWLTHLCHELDHATTEAALPANTRLAYDGLQLETDENVVG